MIGVETNKKEALTFPDASGKFYCFLPILLFISTVACFGRRYFWSPDLHVVSIESSTPYMFNQQMGLWKFEVIFHSLTYTDEEASVYRENFEQFGI